MTIDGRFPALALWLLSCVVGLSAGSVSAVQETSSVRVTNARVESDEPGRSDEVLSLLNIEIGKPLDRAELRRRIRAMYASGEVDTFRVDTEPTPIGLSVVIHISYTPLVEEIKIEAPRTWRRRILDWLDVRQGSKVSTARIESGVRRVNRRLRERGYENATIEPELHFDRSRNTVRLLLPVDLGEPLRIQSLHVIHSRSRGRLDAVEVPFNRGAILTLRLEERLRNEAEEEFRRHGFWEAIAIGSERLTTDAGVSLQVIVDTGARYRLELECPAEAEDLVRSALPDPAEEPLHPAQTNVISEMVRERLQAEGHLLATTQAELVAEEDERILRIRADPGQHRRVSEVVFDGAASLSEKDLRRAIRVRKGRTGGWRGQEVTSSMLERDRRAIADLYQSRGFADVLVEPARIEAVEDDAVRVVFRLHEGLRWSLDQLRYFDFPVEVAWAIEEMGQTLIRTGPWDERSIERARLRLEAALASSGYPDGTVRVESSTFAVGLVGIVFRANPGQYVRFGEIIVSGLKRTRRGVVQGTLDRAEIVSGEPWSLDAMLNAQRELYELGLFRRVEFVAVPGDARRPVRSVVLRCEEGEQRSYLAGIGWDTVSRARVTLGWSHLNVLGGAHAFSSEVRLSGLEQRFQASLHESRLPYIGVPGYVVAYWTEEVFPTYSQRRTGLWFEAGDRRRRPWRPWLRYEYQLVRPDAPDEIKSELERREQEVRISSLTPTLEWDTRDDLLSPTRGVLARASLEYAFPLFQANVKFLKLRTDFSLHKQTRHGVAAVGVRLGAIRPLGPDSDDPPNLQVPINSRFFAGGPSTHRAFPLDYLGVPGQTLNESGDPMGGNALVLINLEYQRHVSGPFSAVVFIDGGNVWAEPAQVKAGDLRWGFGLGVRYDTPAGPLRAEYCAKLDRLEGESRGEFFFSFGIPF
ncbi:MAG: BamA/TamA family outer membrane protein [bacterium]|nr:BamA/TamA family outer membrane protein [bacterium]